MSITILPSVTSTNDELRQRVANGASLPLVVAAASQSAGRGRMGRQWNSPQGGLYLSIGIELATAIDAAIMLPLVTALAVREVLSVSAAGDGLQPGMPQIKWPNDIVVGSKKLAGILVETLPLAGTAPSSSLANVTRFVIGIGINVNRPATDAFERAIYLSDASSDAYNLHLEPLAESISSAVIAATNAWQNANFSFTSLAAEYNRYLAIIGEHVTVRDAQGTTVASGIVQGINAHGYLLLNNNGTIQTVTAGEVTLRS